MSSYFRVHDCNHSSEVPRAVGKGTLGQSPEYLLLKSSVMVSTSHIYICDERAKVNFPVSDHGHSPLFTCGSRHQHTRRASLSKFTQIAHFVNKTAGLILVISNNLLIVIIKGFEPIITTPEDISDFYL
ncbi:hypothetical protein AMECASPLE_022867 [Ameca splendens]|uniref:Uncharacterized protein n=1 Tax=Ameca splendens TaxID=208324 RepID=A0ABV0XGZ7_9TELE